MPWSISKRDGKWCVVKDDDGEVEGCHGSRADAVKQQRALYASEDDMSTETDTFARWSGPIALEGWPTSDRRMLMAGQISERALPLPLNVQLMTGEAHDNSTNAGSIETLERIPLKDFVKREEFNLSDVPDDVVVVWAEGTLDDCPEGHEAARLLKNGYGVSVDLPPDRVALLDPVTLAEVDMDTVEMGDVMAGMYLTGIAGKIAGATVVNVPAFEHATIAVQDGLALVAAGFRMDVQRVAFAESDGNQAVPDAAWDELRTTAKAALESTVIRDSTEGVLALAAAAMRPTLPGAWFNPPDLRGPTPLTITDEGRIYGHLAPWNGCHVGYSSQCTPPPNSPSKYAYFHVGIVDTDDGPVTCGKLMFSRDTPGKHASLEFDASQAAKHYDDATKIAGFVRAGEDSFGIWLAGALAPGLTDLDIAYLKANPPSGDWRPINGHSELIAAFSVPVPGFPIPQAEARLVASADGEHIAALIIHPQVMVDRSRAQVRRLRMLSDRARASR